MYDEQGKRPTISLMFGRRNTVNGHKLENIFDGNVSFFYSRQFTVDSWTRFSVSLLPKVHKSVGIGRAMLKRSFILAMYLSIFNFQLVESLCDAARHQLAFAYHLGDAAACGALAAVA